MSNDLKTNASELSQDAMQLVTLDSVEHSVLKQVAKTVTFPLDSETQEFIHNYKESFG